mmetsp:Transcript_17348/g.29166  ORF Transcript_17348/g.29166 Transcript_17348/m.29166 type:complete len:83 (+) Transcript_17348:207-455(+)
MDRMRRLVHFKELRSGRDMAQVMQRAIRFHDWSGGDRAKHLFQGSVRDNSYFTVYDFDIKLEMLSLLLITVLAISSGLKKLT